MHKKFSNELYKPDVLYYTHNTLILYSIARGVHEPNTIIVLRSNVHLQMWLFFLSATSDYASTTGEVTIDSDNTRQCISILIRIDTLTESTECFSFGITLSNTVANLTVEPDTASICIIDKNCI